jgi:hypothetical protein
MRSSFPRLCVELLGAQAGQACNAPIAHVTVCYAYDNKKRTVSSRKMMEFNGAVATSMEAF